VAVQQLATDQQGLLVLVQQMAAEQSKLMQRLQVQQVLIERLSANTSATTTAPAAAAAAPVPSAAGGGAASGSGQTQTQQLPPAAAAAGGSATSAAAPQLGGVMSLDPVRSRAEVKSPIREYIQSSGSSSKEERGREGAGSHHGSKP
jgi:hypothetical protein